MPRRTSGTQWEVFGLMALGVGALYLVSKSTAPAVYPAGFVGPVQPGSIVGGQAVGSAGSLVSWLTNLFHGGSSTVNPGNVPLATGGATDITDINQMGPVVAPPGTTDVSQGCNPGGNVCDPGDCDYNAQVCQEMYGQ